MGFGRKTLHTPSLLSTNYLNGNADIVTNIGAGNIVTRVGDAPQLFLRTIYKGVYATDAEAAAEGLQANLFTRWHFVLSKADAKFDD